MIGSYSCGAAARVILEPANPMSLCVEVFMPRHGNIKTGVGKVPMSRTGDARNAFRPVAHKRRARRTNGAVKMTPLSDYVGYALRRAQGVIYADLNHTLAELDLRPFQFAALVTI